jgi:glyoxylase-like metal-dependent hydrolase (beta-lactamase superfamily II)
VTFGDFELTPLVEGWFRLDGGAMFGVVPKPLWERRAPADDRNRIRLGLRPLLIRGHGRTILVDAGIGGKMDARSADIYGIERVRDLDRALEEADAPPREVDTVLATHLHFDHAGGFTRGSGGHLAPAFPAARYLVRRGEWEDAVHPHERNRASYLPDNFLPLESAGVLDFLEDDGEVVPGVRVVRTGGHTMHHQIALIESRGRTAVFAADLLPTRAHVDLAWIMGYDLYPMDTLAFKRRFLGDAIRHEYLIFFEHDPDIAAGVIREKGGRPFVEQVI